MVLRPALPGEAAALTALCLRAKAFWGYDDAFMAACARELTLAEGDLSPQTVRVAEIDGRRAGLAEISVDGTKACLEKLFVDPPFMGMGVGRALFDWATARAAERGAAVMTIDADPGAADFYRRRGARDAGSVASGSIPGRMLPHLRYDLT